MKRDILKGPEHSGGDETTRKDDDDAEMSLKSQEVKVSRARIRVRQAIRTHQLLTSQGYGDFPKGAAVERLQGANPLAHPALRQSLMTQCPTPECAC
jgi:hypothetical protein